MSNDVLQRMAFVRTATEPFFIGCHLARLRQAAYQTPQQQAEALGLDLDALVFLALCRMPFTGEWSAVRQIAQRVGLDVGQLAVLLGMATGGP